DDTGRQVPLAREELDRIARAPGLIFLSVPRGAAAEPLASARRAGEVLATGAALRARPPEHGAVVIVREPLAEDRAERYLVYPLEGTHSRAPSAAPRWTREELDAFVAGEGAALYQLPLSSALIPAPVSSAPNEGEGEGQGDDLGSRWLSY